MKLDSTLSSVAQHLGDVRRPAAQPHEVVGGHAVGAEAADRQHGAVQRQRWDDGVDARAVRQARVHHRRGLVDAPPDARNDAVDDPQQVRLVAEAQLGALQLAVTLDKDLVRPVDQDVGDLRVRQ
jgi:hypothetical protein